MTDRYLSLIGLVQLADLDTPRGNCIAVSLSTHIIPFLQLIDSLFHINSQNMMKRLVENRLCFSVSPSFVFSLLTVSLPGPGAKTCAFIKHQTFCCIHYALKSYYCSIFTVLHSQLYSSNPTLHYCCIHLSLHLYLHSFIPTLITAFIHTYRFFYI